MSIPKNKLADVKRQVFKARAAEEKEEGHVPTPTRREQLRNARMAAPVTVSSWRARPQKTIDYVAPAAPRMLFNLEVDSLVRINRDTICLQASPDAVAPFVPVKKGDIGVLIARASSRRRRGGPGGRAVEYEVGHVMLPQGLLEVDLAYLRGADEPEEE